VESAPTAATVEGDGSDFLDRVVEALDELAEFCAVGATRDGDSLAPLGISTLLGVEESAPIGPAHHQYGTPRSDSADECRQSSLGCARIHGELLKLGLAVSQAMVSIHA